MLPIRAFEALFGATVKPTVPEPLPDSGGERLSQPTSVVAVHAHSADVVTVTLPPSPDALTL